jgi:hypothetical protein
MILRDDNNGVEITLEYDEDGFPLVNIDLGGGFYGDNQRPTVEVKLDGVLIHDMFDDQDKRWAEGHCALCGEPAGVGHAIVIARLVAGRLPKEGHESATAWVAEGGEESGGEHEGGFAEHGGSFSRGAARAWPRMNKASGDRLRWPVEGQTELREQ